MSDDLAKAILRVRQNRTAAGSARALVSDTRVEVRDTARGPILAGDRVFDALTGSEGTVIATTTLVDVARGVISVQLDRGAMVTRAAEDLAPRPRPPIG